MIKTIFSLEQGQAPALFLNRSGEWWDQFLVVSLILAAIAAVAVGFATAGSVVAHKREAEKTKADFEIFRLETQRQIVQADERALQAKKSLEEYKADRVLPGDPSVMLAFAALKQFSDTKVTLLHVPGNEPTNLATTLRHILSQNFWGPKMWQWQPEKPLTGLVVYVKPGAETNVEDKAQALLVALKTTGLNVTRLTWPGAWEIGGVTGEVPFGPDSQAVPLRLIVAAKY